MAKTNENTKWTEIFFICVLTAIFLFYEIYTLELYLPIMPQTNLIAAGIAYLIYMGADIIIGIRKPITTKSGRMKVFFMIFNYGVFAPTLAVNLFYNLGEEIAAIIFNFGLLIFFGIEIWVLQLFRRYCSSQKFFSNHSAIMLILILVISSVPGLIWEIKYLNNQSHVISKEYVTASSDAEAAFVPYVQNFALNPNITNGYGSLNEFTQFRYDEDPHLLNRPGPNMYPRRIYEQFHTITYFSDGIIIKDENFGEYSTVSYE